ncbi:MAG: hypothetical protein E7640_06300 [Ruminococcaceae bacterium]|nr:hypothetical protein [Oscillospiraceae bacterium]
MNNTSEKKLLLRTRLTVLVSALALNTLFALVLSPLYSRAFSDKAFGFDYLPDILDALMLITHLASFFIAYAVTAYSVFRFSLKKTVPTILIFSFLTVYKYGLNLIAGWFIYDAVPTAGSAINLSLLSFAANVLLELLQYGIVIFIIVRIIRKAMPAFMLRKKQLEKLGDKEFSLRECVFPFEKIYEKKNPLQKAALGTAIAVAALRVAQRLVYDVFVGGVPTALDDIIWVAVYYIGSLLILALGYLFMLLVLMKLDASDK